MWLQALTSGFQRMRVKVTFVRTKKDMLLTVFWRVTLFAEHVTLMEAAVVTWLRVGFLWYNRSFLLRSNVQYITLYLDTDRTSLIIYYCYKMAQLLGLSEASLWRIVGTVMKYEVSNNLNSNNCRVKVFLTHRCLVYFYHWKWLQNIFRRIYREKRKDSRIAPGKPSKTYRFTVEQTFMKLVEHSKVASLPTFLFWGGGQKMHQKQRNQI